MYRTPPDRRYAPRVEILASDGVSHLRYVPGQLAAAMVNAGAAAIANANGKVKSVKLARPATMFAEVIGPPTAGRMGVRFVGREKLDGGYTVWRFLSRSFG